MQHPPLKLVIIEGEGEPGSINHLGFELPTGEAVASETQRLTEAGIPPLVDDTHTCCYATQEKSWSRDLDGVLWEFYTVVSDTDHFGHAPQRAECAS